MQANNAAPHLGRVVKACDRCHRQKLKCDPFRPCLLCQRAGVSCSTSSPKSSTSVKRRRSALEDNDLRRQEQSQLPKSSNVSNLVQAQGSRAESIVTLVNTVNSVEDQDLGATTSSIEFARSVFGSEGGDNLTSSSLIPGHADGGLSHDHTWTLGVMQLPPGEVMQLLIDKYFEGYHWYICLFQEQKFRDLADRILSMSTWSRRDMSNVNVVLSVALLGLQVGLKDETWSGASRLRALSIDPAKLLLDLSTEVRLHLIDIVEDCTLEAVQICLLLATFHVYHDSPSLAWSLTGMAVSVSYTLGLHSSRVTTHDVTLQQIRNKCWNHCMVADTFGSMIYGRPGSIDPTFSTVHELFDLDQKISDPSILNHPIYGLPNAPTTASFHTLKCKLYRIIRHALDRVRIRKFNDGSLASGIESSIEGTKHVQELLTQIRATFPPIFEWDNWNHSDPWEYAERQESTSPTRNQWRQLLLQAFMIQVLYNAAVMLTHRPLLEHKISSLGQFKPSKHVLDSIRASLDMAVQAALCMSQISLQRLRDQFCISFAFMHLFTAGVILCMAPASQPLSHLSQLAKEGVVRIIRTSREWRTKNRIAQHTEKLLNELLKITLQREIDNALKTHHGDEGDQVSSLPIGIGRSRVGATSGGGPQMSRAESSQARLPQIPYNVHPPDLPQSRENPINYPNPTISSETPDVGFAEGIFVPYLYPSSQWTTGVYNDMSFDAGGFDEMMFNLLPFDNNEGSFNSSFGYDR